MQLEGKDGVFIAFPAWQDILAAHARELGEQRNETAIANVTAEQEKAKSKAYKHAAEQQLWRATWGPVIGGTAGFVLGVCATAGGEGLVEAMHR